MTSRKKLSLASTLTSDPNEYEPMLDSLSNIFDTCIAEGILKQMRELTRRSIMEDYESSYLQKS
jgi:hypothetical protein